MSTPTAQTWTTRRLIAWMTDAFKQKGLDRPRLLAEDLLAHVIGCKRLNLYTDQDREASEVERGTLRDLVQRALKHEPVQYLVGQEHFFGLQMKVDRRVLIPRPSTQTIIEEVLQHARAQPGFALGKGAGVLIADICTGSGCIAISLLKNLPGARAVATDISPEALEVAKDNAIAHGVADRVDFMQGNLLEPLASHPLARVDGAITYLVSNPPYIPDHEWEAIEPNVKDHEPHLALRGGPDGLDLIRPLFAAAPAALSKDGFMVVEVAASHAKAAADIAAAQAGLTDVTILNDCDDLPRMVRARRQ